MRKLLAQERGSALLAAMVLIGVMMATGLATASFVDGQQTQSGQERVRESAFNAAESALEAQVFQLSRQWPTTIAGAYPTTCTSTSGPGLPCPDNASLSASFTSADYNTSTCTGGSASLWTTSVHDDGGAAADYYDAATVNAQPTYDSNANGRLWVRSVGAARCKERTIITMVSQGRFTLNFPRNVVTANWIATTNQGRKVIIDTLGSYAQPPSSQQSNAQPGDVVARCTAPAPSPCLNYDSAKGQISPNTAKISTTTPATTMTPTELAAFKSRAVALGTYFPSGNCPSSLTGSAVYVEDFTGCSASSGNSPTSPGALYIARGTISFGGNMTFYGLVYMGNLQGSSGAVISLGGTASIQGAIAVDGAGGVYAGSSKTNIIYDSRVFDLLEGAGTVGLTPNTWRELPRGQ